jgi:hypothetical protein
MFKSIFQKQWNITINQRNSQNQQKCFRIQWLNKYERARSTFRNQKKIFQGIKRFRMILRNLWVWNSCAKYGRTLSISKRNVIFQKIKKNSENLKEYWLMKFLRKICNRRSNLEQEMKISENNKFHPIQSNVLVSNC